APRGDERVSVLCQLPLAEYVARERRRLLRRGAGGGAAPLRGPHRCALLLRRLRWAGPAVCRRSRRSGGCRAAAAPAPSRAAARGRLGPAAAGGRRARFRNGVQDDDRCVDDAALVAVREPVHALRRARHRTRSRSARRARLPGAPDGLVRGISRNPPEAHLVAPAGGAGPAAAADRRASAGLARSPALAACAILAVPAGWTAMRAVSELKAVLTNAHRRPWAYARWEPAFEWLREQHALVFIRYPRAWDGNVDLTYNEPDLAHADLVRAIDKGERNAELLPYFPGRPAFVLDPLTLRAEQIR